MAILPLPVLQWLRESTNGSTLHLHQCLLLNLYRQTYSTIPPCVALLCFAEHVYHVTISRCQLGPLQRLSSWAISFVSRTEGLYELLLEDDFRVLSLFLFFTACTGKFHHWTTVVPPFPHESCSNVSTKWTPACGWGAHILHAWKCRIPAATREQQHETWER